MMLRVLMIMICLSSSAVMMLRLVGGSSDMSRFIFAGCSSLKCSDDSSNLILKTIVNSALYSSYGNSSAHGLFQCRGDLPSPDCARCVALAAAHLGTLCLHSCGGALQLDACFVRYDNASFVGLQDKALMLQKCGPSAAGYASGDEGLEYLGASGGTFRRSGGGVAQCVGDLSPSECQDCLSDAIGRLKTECASASAAWGDVFLAKCYARYSHAPYGDREGNNDNETEKTLAILIGLIAAVTLLIVFLSFLRKSCERGAKGGK